MIKKRTIPEIPIYRGGDKEVSAIMSRLREAIQGIVGGDFTTENDIYCRDLILSGDSIYLGSKRPERKISVRDGQLEFNDEPVGAGGGEGGAVTSVNSQTGDVVLDKTDIGLSNVTNDEQIPLAQKAVANGVASLDAIGRVPITQLSVVGLSYKGVWNANTNTPTLSDNGGGGVNGDIYVVSVAGTTTIDGISVWAVGDRIINQGTLWAKIPSVDLVISVAGKQGVVILDSDDVGLGNVLNSEQIPATEKGATNGVATLGGTSKLTDAQLPAPLYQIDLLSPINDDILQRKSDAWTNRTPGQLKADMGLNNVPDLDTTDAVNNEHTHAHYAQLELVTDGDHDVRTDNPHGVTKTQITLGNVTNDAQLKRADGDINSFTVKGSPASADVLLIEDSVAGFAKKKITIGTLPGGGGGLSHAQVMARIAMGF